MLEFLFDKVAGLQGSNFIKKNLHYRCFLVKFAKFLRIPILKNICKWLLLKILAHSPQSSQCCPNTAETILRKKITGAMLAQTTYRSSPGRYSVKKCVLKNFAIFTGKHLRWSLSLIKLQAFSPAALLKRDSNTGVFLCIMQNS